MKKRVVMYGAGGTGKRILPELEKQYEVIAVIDSDSKKWGSSILGRLIENPEDVLKNKDRFEYVIVASQPGKDAIYETCRVNDIEEERVVDKYVSLQLNSRIQFIKDWSSIYGSLDGAVAEVGVFEGDFAKHLNSSFPNKELYLFDTFEGFDARDIWVEQRLSSSVALQGDYRNTSVDLVMSKMTYPEKVHIKKGYFPDSARGIEESFCFVNLDVDLYKPTLEGLKWLKGRIKKNGAVLVHDYFSETYGGPRQAVDEFLNMNPEFNKLPIGDGISILLVGF